MTSAAQEDPARGPIWDPLVRLTHWGIAIAVILNGLIVNDEALAHIWIGYVALALLALRLLWGLIGPPPARFTAFPPNLRGAIAHIHSLRRGEHSPHRSHNPLGALMAYALWATLAVTALTGVAMDGDPFPGFDTDDRSYVGAEPERDDSEGDDEGDDAMDEVIKDVHEVAANLLLLLALLHVGGVVFESRRSGRNLIAAMTWHRNGRS